MADANKKDVAPVASSPAVMKPAKPEKPPNPVFRMMGTYALRTTVRARLIEQDYRTSQRSCHLETG